MQITIEELEMLLGNKDVEIYVLKRQLEAAQKRIAELTPKPDAPALEAVKK